MSAKLRILLVEDSEDDAFLLIRELQKGGYDLEYEQVGSSEKFIFALDNGQWDIVITDYSLPGFSGMAALEILKQRDEYIPAIMVSGKMGEDTAVEAMRAGANDYILKGNFVRLIPAIERELREAAVWRSRQTALVELRQNEVRYRAIVEDQTEVINRYNLDGVITFANSAYARLFDKTPDEVIGLTQKDIISEEAHLALEEIRMQLSVQTPIISSQHPQVLPNGDVIWLQWLDRLILDTDGNPIEYQGVGRDITELKRAENELKDFAENLERYATQLQVAAEIARDAATARDLDSLLNRAVDLVVERLGFYYAGVFLLDDVGAFAVLTAASGEAGAKFLAQGHKLKVGEMGIVGPVAKLGQPRIVLDVDTDPGHIKQSLLPATRSEMAVPLKVMNRVIGVFDVQNKQASAFDENDLVAMQTMADQLAIAIENMRLVIEAQRRSQELSGLYDAALATSSVLDTNMLLDRLYEQVNRLMAPDTFIVALYDSRDETFSIAFAIENEEPVVEFIDQSYSLSQGGLTGWVLENRQPLLVGDIDVDSLPIEPIRGLEPVHAWLGVPLVSRSNLIGAVSVQSFRPHVFDNSHQRFLESLAAQSATALENARLFEAEQAAREQAETLQGIAQVIGSSLEPEKILELILGQLKRVLTFDTASVLLWKSSGSPAFAAAIGYENLDLVKSESGGTLENSQILMKMVQDHKSIIIPDVRQDPDWIWVPGADNVRSFMAAPVIVRDEMIGVLMADSNNLNYFTDGGLKTVQALARHMAVAIENANLFEAERIARENAEALRDAAQVIGSTLSVDEVIEAVLDQLIRVLPYDSACVYLVEDNKARIQAGRGYEKFTDFAGLSSITLALDSASVQRIVRDGNTLLIPDVGEYPGWVQTEISDHVRSYLGVPLRVRDQVVGFFSLDRVIPGSFNTADMEIGQIFAAQTAAAIENARLFKAEEKRAAELEDPPSG